MRSGPEMILPESSLTGSYPASTAGVVLDKSASGNSSQKSGGRLTDRQAV